MIQRTITPKALIALATLATGTLASSGSAQADTNCLEAMTSIPPVPCIVSSSGSPTGEAPICVPVPLVDDRCEAWIGKYDHEGGHATTGYDMGFAVAHSPDGATVYVAGQSWDDATNYDFVVIAYDVADGAEQWTVRWNADGDAHDIPTRLAVSHDGSKVFVVGHAHMGPTGSGADYGTIALNSGNGSLLWSATYDAVDGDEAAFGIAVSPDDQYVYITGKSGVNQHGDVDYGTVAYDANTGGQDWAARYSRIPGTGEDIGVSVATSPDGNTLFVTGAAAQTVTTIAYAAGDSPNAGAELWRHVGASGYGYWIDVSPDGERIYVSGSAHLGFTSFFPNWQMVTYALDAATGSPIWERRLRPANDGVNVPYDQALSEDGENLVVVGVANDVSFPMSDQYAALLDAATGEIQWEDQMSVPGSAVETATSVGFDGDQIVLTGFSASISYRAEAITRGLSLEGTQVWIARVYDPLAATRVSAISVSDQSYVVVGDVSPYQPVTVNTINASDMRVFAYRTD